MIKLLLLLLFTLLGCNSQEAQLSSIQGMRDPNDPQPYITSVTTSPAALYTTGTTLSFDVSFSVPVTVTGTPTLPFTTGSGVVFATYTAGSDTQVLNFIYTVPVGDYDPNGIALNGRVELNGGSISDPADDNDPALLTYSLPDTSGILIDTINPVITAVIPPANGTYKEASNLDFLVRFDYPVSVTGTPLLPIDISGATRSASYVSGSGTRELLFRYIVPAGLTDLDGVDVLVSSLNLNAGAINDSFGDPADVAITQQYNDLVLVDSVKPFISGSITVPADGTYSVNDNMDFVVNFSEAVKVSGSPLINFSVDGGSIVSASYISGSGTSSLLFRYTVGLGKDDSNGISVDPTLANSSVITDLSGNGLTSSTMTVPTTLGIKIETVNPVITSITPPLNGTYKAANTLDFTIHYDQPVNVTGVPTLSLDISGTKEASYVSGSGTNDLLFRYTVPSGVTDLDGIAINASTLLLGTGVSITDIYGGPASVALTTQAYVGILVDSTNPYISGSISVPVNGTYSAGDVLNFYVNFSEDVIVDVSPYIQFTVDSGEILSASYVSGSGTTQLRFKYIVQLGKEDANGITVDTALINAASISDSAGNLLTSHIMTVPTTAGVLIDTVHPVITSITPPADGTYKEGENLDFVVHYDSAVTVAGTPVLPIDVNGAREALYVSGSGTTDLLFRYTVPAGISDLDGVDILATSLTGSINDSLGDPASLTITPQSNALVLVDSIKPLISSLTVPANGTYTTGQNMDFTLNFSEAVSVSGTPNIQFSIDTGAILTASYVSGSGTSALLFRYIVELGKDDNTGITVDGTLIEGISISDSAGNVLDTFTMTVPSTAGVLIDTIHPVITSITPPLDGTYKEGNNLDFIVRYDDVVTVVGTPVLPLDISGTKEATYLSGSGTTDLVFRYTVPAGVTDTNGVDITASSLIVGAGSAINDSLGDPASVAISPQTNPLVLVDSTLPYMLSPIVVPVNGSYATNDSMEFIVNFSEAVTVGGSPRIQFTIDSGSTLTADYVSGSGTTSLLFRYYVEFGKDDPTGISVEAFLVNGSGITDWAGNALDSLAMTVPDTTGVIIETVYPVITSITPPLNGTYLEGNNLDFTVTYDHPVDVTGVPGLPLSINGATAEAAYVSGSGSNDLVFRYTVPAGVTDSDGVDITATSLVLGAGDSIDDAYGGPASLTIPTQSYPGVLVDSANPVISSLTVPLDRTYYTNENLEFTVTFSEAVNVTGTPAIQFAVDSGDILSASYVSGSGTSALLFRYTVTAGRTDTNGITVHSTLATATGITDSAGNALTSTTMTVPSTTGIKIDGVAPTISSVTASNASGTYVQDDTLSFTVTFSESVWVGGNPKVTLNIGGTTAYASCVWGAGVTSIFCSYTIPTGLLDQDGVEIVSPLDLNGATITDGPIAAANTLTNTAFTSSTATGVLVDSTAPTITGVSFTTGSYRPTNNFTISVTYSKPISVSGTPRIELLLDSGVVYANYLSTSTNIITFKYIVGSTDLDMTGMGLNNTSIVLNGGTITDTSGNSAPLLLTSVANTTNLSKVFVIPTQLTYWFDASDTATVGTSGSTTLQQFTSKATAFTGSIVGSPSLVAGPYGSKFISFVPDASIYLPTITNTSYLLIAYKTSASPTGEALFYNEGNYTIGSPELDYYFNPDQSVYVGSYCVSYGCATYSGSGWYPVDSLGLLTNHLWNSNEYRMVLIDLKNFPNLQLKLADLSYEGQIAEVMIFTQDMVNPAIFQSIGNYLSTKHGTSW